MNLVKVVLCLDGWLSADNRACQVLYCETKFSCHYYYHVTFFLDSKKSVYSLELVTLFIVSHLIAQDLNLNDRDRILETENVQ